MVIPDVHGLGGMLEGYNQEKPLVFGSGPLRSNNHVVDQPRQMKVNEGPCQKLARPNQDILGLIAKSAKSLFVHLPVEQVLQVDVCIL